MKRRKFIKATGASAIAVTGVSPLLTWACSESKSSDTLLKEQALLAFKRFEEVWDFQDFWKRGNTFDACLVFVDALQKRWSEDKEVVAIQEKVGKMLEENLAFFQQLRPRNSLGRRLWLVGPYGTQCKKTSITNRGIRNLPISI